MPAERPNYIVPRNGIGAGLLFLLLLSLALIASCEFSLSERQNPELVFSEDYSELDVFYNDPDFLKEETRDLYGKAMVQIRNGDFQQAREKLLQAKALEPENAAILFNLGNLALEDSEYQQALEYYGMVSNDSVVNSHQRYGIGSTYFSMGEYESAIGSLERILVNSRNEVLHAGAYYLLTKSYAELQRCEESRASLQSFKELTGHLKDFRVMTQELEFWALNCGKSSKRQELWVNSGNRNHEFELRTYSLRDSLTASPDSTAQFSR